MKTLIMLVAAILIVVSIPYLGYLFLYVDNAWNASYEADRRKRNIEQIASNRDSGIDAANVSLEIYRKRIKTQESIIISESSSPEAKNLARKELEDLRSYVGTLERSIELLNMLR